MTIPERDSSPCIVMSGEMTKVPPPSRAIAAWKEASVRNDGLRKRRESTLP